MYYVARKGCFAVVKLKDINFYSNTTILDICLYTKKIVIAIFVEIQCYSYNYREDIS